MAEVKRSTGTVKWFSGQKGFGFVSPDDGGDDLFVHQTEIQSDGFRTLREGQRVEFVVEAGEDGRTKAVDVMGMAGSSRPYGGRGSAVRGGGGGRGGECYNCGRMGHLARDCYQGGGGRNQGYGGGGGGGGGACYSCGEEGHFARDCPNVQK